MPTHATKALVESARKRWVARLIDRSRGNSLLFYRQLKVGTLLLDAVPKAVVRLLRGDQLKLDDLLPDLPINAQSSMPAGASRAAREAAKADVRARLVALQRKALANHEEKGLSTLFLALGRASWTAGDGGRDYDAPVLLLPFKIEASGAYAENLRVTVTGDPQANEVLLHVLSEDHKVGIDGELLLSRAAAEAVSGQWEFHPESAYELLRRQCSGISGFAVSDRAVVGNFHFAKMAMVEDLHRNAERLSENPVIAGLAGDASARRTIRGLRIVVDPHDLDERPAREDLFVIPADHSQRIAIARACGGETGVIHGPPGTGKSQTIANLIVQLAACGKRVLFVAEKRAALQAVVKRLCAVGLEHLVLDLHGASVSRKAVMSQLARALAAINATTPVDSASLENRVERTRELLNRRAKELHKQRSPTGKSIFDLYGEILVRRAHHTSIRWRGANLTPKIEDWARKASELFREVGGSAPLFLGISSSPWNNAVLDSVHEAQASIDITSRVATELGFRCATGVGALCREAGLPPATSMSGGEAVIHVVDDAARLLSVYGPALVEKMDVIELARALEPAGRGLVRRTVAFLSRSDYRAARRTALRSRTSKAPAPVLLNEMRAAANIRARWVGLGGDWRTAHIARPTESARTVLGELRGALSKLYVVVPSAALGDEFVEIVAQTQALYDARRDAAKTPRLRELRRDLDELDLVEIVDEFRRRSTPAGAWIQTLEFAWFSSALEAALADAPDFTTFDGRAHDDLVTRYKKYDDELTAVNANRVARAHGEAAVSVMNEHPEQTSLVRGESQKKSRHLPLRDLLRLAPDVLTRITPCWIASPLSVSQLLDGSQGHFDVVIFDEASQVLPEEAVPALFRAKQAVVAGDHHQLPPTTFFASFADGDDEDLDDSAIAVEGFESVLDTLSAFVDHWPLDVHYRSEDERLIAFSNQNIYDGRLVTFPSVTERPVLTHFLAPSGVGLSGQEESASPEIVEVVRFVLEHATVRPTETLGVITMGIKHANRVQAAVDEAVRDRPELAEFFSYERAERFFVKNLETVQGDERDVTVLTVGYGKDSSGSLPHRFGPLTQDVGYRRLNVAITRARRRMHVVSSFTHSDVDLTKSGSRGVKLLKGFLEYAANGGTRLPSIQDVGVLPLNSFEADIKDALEAAGVPIAAQFGVSRFVIDLVAMHPKRVGRPVLAIECDGRSYHSTPTARDRDRLRQEELMRRGWRFHRIWSTDWFENRPDEIARAVACFRDAVAYADFVDTSGEMPVLQQQTHQLKANPATPKRRGPCPLTPGLPISGYGDPELQMLVKWIESDGRLRTNDEVLAEMIEVLEFGRLGKRIKERCVRAIDNARRFGRS